jgi:hypothetical protein
LLFYLEPVLGLGNNASLCNLLPVLVIKNHSHGVFKILKLLMIDILYLRVAYLSLFDQGKQNIGSKSLHLEIKMLCHLALLKRLVYSPNVLPQR